MDTLQNLDIEATRVEEISAILAERSSAYFGNWVSDGHDLVPRHLEYISSVVDPLLDKGGARIVLCAPPRHGKSELINKNTAARFIWRDPRRRVILAGHNSSFATTWGRKVRDLLCENYRRLGVRINGGWDAAMDEWYTDKEGGMRCAGVGVGIVGLGADLFIIDDPTPDSKAALSPVHQNDLKEWYQGVADRRLEPNASVVVSMQRWPGYDFVSWLTSMNDQGRQKWTMISLADTYDVEEQQFGPDLLGRDPLANNGLGEALWPERWPIDELVRKRRMSEDISFYYAQYRQRPPDQSRDGIAYGNFHPVHNTSIKVIDPNKPIYWFLDFNVDPMTSVIAQVHTRVETTYMDNVLGRTRDQEFDRELHVLNEIYLRHSTTQAACQAFEKTIKQMFADAKLKVNDITVIAFGDASGFTRKSTSPPDYTIIKEQMKALFGGRCSVIIKSPRVNPTQRNRVTLVNNCLYNAEGIRSLFISDKCVELRQDFMYMKWHRDSSGNPTNDLDDTNPARGHISDGLGYGVTGVMGKKAKYGEHEGRIL